MQMHRSSLTTLFVTVAGILVGSCQLSATTKIAFFSDRSGTLAIYTMSPDGTDVTLITDNEGRGAINPEWSSDGRKMVFESEGDIWIMNSDGTSPVRVTSHPATDGVPSLSPDGSKIAFASNRDGNWEVYSVDVDGTNETNLTQNLALDSDPDWSPDGTEIVFHSRRSGSDEVHIMRADGTDLRRITPGDLWTACEAWSPDGSKIAFGALDEIWLVNVDGTGLVQLTSALGQDNCPSWSADGSEIVFHSIRDGNWEIYKMYADGTGTTRLTNVPAAYDHRPSWSPELLEGCCGFPVGSGDCSAHPLGEWHVSTDLLDPDYPGRPHTGEDWNWGNGDEDLDEDVCTIGDGEIVRVDRFPTWSNVVVIKHILGDGTIRWSQYAHLRDVFVTEDQLVRRGQKLGTVGKQYPHRTCISHGPKQGFFCAHLHFEIRQLEVPADNWPAQEEVIRQQYLDPTDHPRDLTPGDGFIRPDD